MGKLILLAERHAARSERRRRERLPSPDRRRAATFWFDLSNPFSYLAAERVERRFPVVRWRPAYGAALRAAAAEPGGTDGSHASAATRAAALHMPLVWPEDGAREWRGAARAALYAAERGRGAPFVLAAGRLAFCGGFDLDDPEVLAEAASAAGLAPLDCLAAAADEARDDVIHTATSCLDAAGTGSLPALQVGSRIFSGERQIAAALSGAVDGGEEPPVTHAGEKGF
ncbi:MAG: DsbA family protein [Solirubrobacteraceae bacterium]